MYGAHSRRMTVFFLLTADLPARIGKDSQRDENPAGFRPPQGKCGLEEVLLAVSLCCGSRAVWEQTKKYPPGKGGDETRGADLDAMMVSLMFSNTAP
jgi:hypothetical protein